MPRLRLARFSDLAFIQAIDKPRFFQPFLFPYKSYFRRQGLDITKLGNDDEDDRKLLEVFTRPDEEMPQPLLASLYELDDLADEAGHDRLLDESNRQGVSLDEIVGKDLSPGEFAIAVHLQHPKVVRASYDKTIYMKMRNYDEYRARGTKRLTLASARKGRPALERELAPWFERNDRSPVCDIYLFEEDGGIKLEITHGRPYRTDGTIDKNLRRSRVAYRPQKHDSAIYDPRKRILKLSAQTRAEKDLYRHAIGKVFFGDPGYFPVTGVYTLTPLQKRRPSLDLVPGIDGAWLTEAWIQLADEDGLLHMWRGRDLLKAARRSGTPNLVQGTLIRAAFLCHSQGSRRPRKVEVRPPNIAIYDRARGGDLMEAFLEANGFLRPAHS